MFWFWWRWGHRVRRRYREMISNVMFREETGARERCLRRLFSNYWIFFRSRNVSQPVCGDRTRKHRRLLFTWTERPKFTLSEVCRNVVPTFLLVMGYNFWKVLTNWCMFEFEGVWRNEREEAFSCQITGNWVQVFLELHLVLLFFSSFVPAWCPDSSSSSFTSYFPFACSSFFLIRLLIFPPSLLLTSPSHHFDFVLHELRVSKLSWVIELYKTEQPEDPLKEQLVFRKS